MTIKRGQNTRKDERELTNLSTGLGNGTQVVDEVSLSHTDTSIADGKDLILPVRDDADVEFLATVQGRGVRQGRVTNFVEGIRAVGNQLSEEDLLVGVERV